MNSESSYHEAMRQAEEILRVEGNQPYFAFAYIVLDKLDAIEQTGKFVPKGGVLLALLTGFGRTMLSSFKTGTIPKVQDALTICAAFGFNAISTRIIMCLAGYSLFPAIASNHKYLDAFDLYKGMGIDRIVTINNHWREMNVKEKFLLVEK